MGDEDNPFRLPPDDQIFLIREQERQRRLEERERTKGLPVWDRHTASTRILLSKKIGDVVAEASASAAPKKHSKMSRSKSDTAVRDVRREKENVADFVEKKREMFLVQMSLDVKNMEIKKLVEKAAQKDQALKKSQQMLDEDVSKFDDFLQKNDQKAHKAMKDAEEETKKKQDRLQRIKHLKSQLSAVQSEIAKHREQKEECMKYKAFLDKITPADWKVTKEQEKRQRKLDRRKRFVSNEMAKHNEAMENEIRLDEQNLEEKYAEALKGRRRTRREQEDQEKNKAEELERRRQRIRRKYPSEDAVSAEYVEVSSGEEMPLYFTKPDQLLEFFTTMEEQNLFLIQTSQDKEQTLEEIQQKLNEKKRSIGLHLAKLHQNMAEVEGSIKEEQEQSEALRQQALKTRGASERDQLLEDLTNTIIEVHSMCGHEPERDNPKLMLKAIEQKLEESLSMLDEAEEEMPQLVEQEIKKKERQRRELVKATRKLAMETKIQERLETSLQRSQLPIHKKVGKQVMFRSPPLYQARRVVVQDEGLEEAIREHEVFGVYIDRKDGFPYPNAPKRDEQ